MTLNPTRTLSNDDHAIHFDRAKEVAHGIDRCLIGSFFIAFAHPGSRGKRGRFGYPRELERKVSVDDVGHSCSIPLESRTGRFRQSTLLKVYAEATPWLQPPGRQLAHGGPCIPGAPE